MANITRYTARRFASLRGVVPNLSSLIRSGAPASDGPPGEVGPDPGLPSIQDMIPTLPQSLHKDASALSHAISEARTAIDVAAGDGSDSEERNESFAASKKALEQYKQLVSRTGGLADIIDVVHPPTEEKHHPEEADHSEQATPTEVQTQTEASQSTMASTSTTITTTTTSTTTAQGSSEGGKPSAAKADPSKRGPGDYIPPKPEDAFADGIVKNPNPVVRIFGPHIETMKYGLFQSSKQRVWIGWSNWF